MSELPAEDTLSFDQASAAWAQLGERVDQLLEAWQSPAEPPRLGDHLPTKPAALRRLTLIELIKVDLEQRWKDDRWRKRLEQYVAEFPELSTFEGLPCDLIYEEYHVRLQAGDEVTPTDYYERFPQHAEELRRLLSDGSSTRSTALQSPERPTQFQPGQQIDDFDLLVSLGQGAFASVFLARQRSLGRMVALKISADRGFETQTLAQLDHPYIVRVFDQRRLPDQQLRLMYMQYVPGDTLSSVVERVRSLPADQRRGSLMLDALDATLRSKGESPPSDSRTRHRLSRMSWPEAVCWLGARLAEALDYAHQRGVLHRDLKPANVLLSADGSPKLADFNISFSNQVQGATAASYFGGSLAYMSPEQLSACDPASGVSPESLDGRSDVYSLGIMLWELLTGRRPFRDEFANFNKSALEQMRALRQAGLDAETLAAFPRNAPSGLLEVLKTCLAPRADDRYATAGDLAAEFELCLRPQSQRLMRPERRGWVARARAWPLSLYVLAGLSPNIVASALNIKYNLDKIIEAPTDAALTGLRRDVFQIQLVIVNPIEYGLAFALLVWLAWPVVRAVTKRGAAPGSPAPDGWVRLRCLRLADYVALVTTAGWVSSGVVFPAWLTFAGAGLTREEAVHFFTSQTLCGLMAATLAFFAVAVTAVRVFLPVLLERRAGDAAVYDQLYRLGSHTTACLVLLVLVLPLGIIAMALLGATSPEALLSFGLVGLLASGAAFGMWRSIRTALSALDSVVNPVAPSGSGGDTTDSFWTASR